MNEHKEFDVKASLSRVKDMVSEGWAGIAGIEAVLTVSVTQPSSATARSSEGFSRSALTLTKDNFKVFWTRSHGVIDPFSTASQEIEIRVFIPPTFPTLDYQMGLRFRPPSDLFSLAVLIVKRNFGDPYIAGKATLTAIKV